MTKPISIFQIILFTTLFFSNVAYSGMGILSLFISPTHKNCPQAVPTNNPNFCTSFKSVANCHCTSSGLPDGMCQDMNAIYNRMVSVFGSQQKACEYQKDVDVQVCMDDWNCYRLGGKDSRGRLCSRSGKRC